MEVHTPLSHENLLLGSFCTSNSFGGMVCLKGIWNPHLETHPDTPLVDAQEGSINAGVSIWGQGCSLRPRPIRFQSPMFCFNGKTLIADKLRQGSPNSWPGFVNGIPIEMFNSLSRVHTGWTNPPPPFIMS